MTELMNVAQLQQAEAEAGEPESVAPGSIPVLRWTIDVATGQAVSRWVLAAKTALAKLSLTT